MSRDNEITTRAGRLRMEATACPTCGAWPGERCIGKKGGYHSQTNALHEARR